MIEIPADVLLPRTGCVAFAPLNGNEIAILGGRDDNNRTLFGDVVTFNTITCVFKKEVEGDEEAFQCLGN